MKNGIHVLALLSTIGIGIASAQEKAAGPGSAASKDGAAADTGAPEGEGEKQYPSWDGNLDGDSIRFMVNVYGLEVYGGTSAEKRCATAQSRARVTADDGKTVSLRFTFVADAGAKEPTFGNTPAAYVACPKEIRVSEGIQYTMSRADVAAYDHRLVGFSFGGLVVPFKYYMGGDKRLAASSTVAPYIGIRLPFFYGTTITPIFSAGLGLIPVNDSESDTTETRAALSTAVGFVMTSSKNESFNSGIIFGRDFIGKNERGDDDTVNKAWFSIYVGYSL